MIAGATPGGRSMEPAFLSRRPFTSALPSPTRAALSLSPSTPAGGHAHGGAGDAPVSDGRARRGGVTTIQIYGRLGRAREQRTTADGKAMVTGSMVVRARRRGARVVLARLRRAIGGATAEHGPK